MKLKILRFDGEREEIKNVKSVIPYLTIDDNFDTVLGMMITRKNDDGKITRDFIYLDDDDDCEIVK